MNLRPTALGLLLTAWIAPAAMAEEEGDSRFTVTQVTGGVWRIDDDGADNAYLVAGTEKALLIDTGLGKGDLAKVVRTLTRLPLTVVVTHGHPDHAGGVDQFAEVHVHPDDLEAAWPLRVPEGKERVRLVPVEDGFVFDLGGGRRLTVVATPGHTPGSICLIASDPRFLFSGDNDNPLQWQFLRESTTLERYLRTLEALNARKDFDTVLPGHGGELDRQFLGDLIACARSILEGSCRDEPYRTFAGEVRLCRRGRAAIAFDPARLR